ncbi:MAG: FlgD immunoglobulin-like domain containing protein, partial [Candidatus Cloacimonadaceae bacterium]|nr:FlgD immunoglobulin-like domain containing protein [Candidatus Cloacimonadaceae bacterium]
IPIGTQANPFYGTLDGNGYKISNLTITRPIVNVADNNNQGLFAATNSASLKNLALINANVSGYNMLGAIVAIATSSIIEDSYSTGTLTGYGNIGGLVGQSSNSVIRSSYSSANISGVNSLGGILGLQSSTVNPAILNCYATGNITQTATGTGIGGLVGLAFSGQVHNSFALGTINGFGTPSSTWGGLIGNVLGNLSFNSYYNSETTGMSDSNKGLPRTTAEMTFPYAENTYIGWDFENAWGADFASVMNGGYPYLRSFGTSISQGDIELVTPDQITLDSGIDSTHPVVMALPNFANLSNVAVFGLSGSGTTDLAVSVGVGNWYGLIYFNGSWHVSTPPFIAGPGYLSFLNVDFGARSDVIVVLSENIDPTLPVELSTFAAVLTSDMYVSILWIAESETNHSGYNVLRNQELDLQNAIRLNPTLITNGVQNGTQISYKFTDMEIQENSVYYYWLESIDLDGSTSFYGPVSVLVDGQGDENPSPELPLRTELLNAYPNPFNPITNIAYTLNEAGRVQIGIYNLKGQLIRSFDRLHSQPGYYSLVWDGKDDSGMVAASGVYFYRMYMGNYRATRKMLLAK